MRPLPQRGCQNRLNNAYAAVHHRKSLIYVYAGEKISMYGQKRKLKRRHLIYYLKVREQATDAPVGYLVDITTGGIMIMSETPIDVNKSFKLKIMLQTDAGDRKYLNFDAVSKWCRQSINSDFFDVGFELLDAGPESFSEIEKIIEELGFRD